MKPYYSDDHVSLYLGDMREILPGLGVQADAVIADPPYAETALAWDRWPDGWPSLAAPCTSSLWCFGSMRMFLERHAEFSDWKLAQDVVWEKHNGSGPDANRFRRVHEHVLHFYRGPWGSLHRDVPRIPALDPADRYTRRRRGSRAAPQRRVIKDQGFTQDGTRLQRSVIWAKSMKGRAIHPTEKPEPILRPLIEYSVPTGGLVVDPFAGSASTLLAARMLGRRAIGIEGHEPYCERAAQRLSVPDLFGGAA